MNVAPTKQEDVQQGAKLEVQYREIGISAVAAALAYKGESKNPAYAPSAIDPRDYPDSQVEAA